ncbi:hypothetical protein [Asticcacaulis sp. AND118]|uniref:hypothetical protein n=1 Tax=Asticcacaulis sp. AND118 TaxID=2840468 RepID=UPI001CFFFE6C|nr:hypothetical protein [Asticcacaulis sp. AND118]UDF02580.1 hypothetical protein LH365_09040 [Asticcacaulis sp. AND118]
MAQRDIQGRQIGQWRQTGIVVLIVAGAHLALGLLFLISRKVRETPAVLPAAEVWLVPQRAVRTQAVRSEAAQAANAPAYRRSSAAAKPSDVVPVVVEGNALSARSHDMAERERLGAVLRHGQDCRKAMMSGAPLPPDCPERGLRQTGPVPVKPGAQPYWDQQVAANEKARRYRTDPGSTEYWQRVNRSRSDPQRYTPQE